MSKTIVTRGHYHNFDEATAAEAISPGHLVRRDANGKFIKQATAGAVNRRTVAVENDIFGKGVTDAYAVNDRVLAVALMPGDTFYGRLAAAATAVGVGDYLEAHTDGTLKKTATAAGASFQALEAVDNSAGGTEVFIHVEVLG